MNYLYRWKCNIGTRHGVTEQESINMSCRVSKSNTIDPLFYTNVLNPVLYVNVTFTTFSLNSLRSKLIL